jgi:LacI family transcriptional regulator
VVQGIAEGLRDERDWLMYHQEGTQADLLPNWFSIWQGDGIIARIENHAMGDALRRKGVPVVDIRGVCPIEGVPVVMTDNAEIARLAAQHLFGCGLKSFAYCGFSGAPDSDQRREAFAACVREAGFKCRIFDVEDSHLAATREREEFGWMHEGDLIEWLRGLPKPSGIMACNDVRGHQVLNAGRLLDLTVPDELAVVGVDNFEMICELAIPPLTSVEQNTRQMGREAVQLLDRMLRGERVPAGTRLVKPSKIVARRSTDALAVPDPQLRKAVECVRKGATSGIRILDVARAAGLSRRELERRFQLAFGHSPGREIATVQIQAIKRLLTETDWPLYQVADQTGFAYPEYLNVVFKRHTGMTPRNYRLQMGRGRANADSLMTTDREFRSRATTDEH